MSSHHPPHTLTIDVPRNLLLFSLGVEQGRVYAAKRMQSRWQIKLAASPLRGTGSAKSPWPCRRLCE
jgi:hypothetical protein